MRLPQSLLMFVLKMFSNYRMFMLINMLMEVMAHVTKLYIICIAQIRFKFTDYIVLIYHYNNSTKGQQVEIASVCIFDWLETMLLEMDLF